MDYFQDKLNCYSKESFEDLKGLKLVPGSKNF